MRCQDFQEGLSTLAEGGSAPEALAHVALCADCAVRLASLRAIVEAARLPQRDARPELIARTKGLMRPRPRLLARLLGAPLGARATKEDDFALHVGAEDVEIHLHYTRTGGRWRVAGRAPDEGWTLVHGDEASPCVPGGRFRLTAPSLDAATFTLCKAGVEIDVPSAPSLLGSQGLPGSQDLPGGS